MVTEKPLVTVVQNWTGMNIDLGVCAKFKLGICGPAVWKEQTHSLGAPWFRLVEAACCQTVCRDPDLRSLIPRPPSSLKKQDLMKLQKYEWARGRAKPCVTPEAERVCERRAGA